MKIGQKISVVMAVYKNDKPSWLGQAIDSVLNQTHAPGEIIVVVDGPVPESITKVLNSYGAKLHVIKLEKNRGLWNALNVGIDAAKNELIARMDADDISAPERFELQLNMFENDEQLSILGGQLEEFSGTVKNIIGRRTVPIEHVDIVQFSKRRSPFNHPTVMYKKSDVLKAGGYQELSRSEDYDLWMRMIDMGYKTKNINTPLLQFRVDKNAISRRTNWRTTKEQIATRWRFLKRRYIGFFDFIVVSAGLLALFAVPRGIAQLVYKKALRGSV